MASIFRNRTRYIILVIHSGLNILQYSICMSLLNTIIDDLPSILDWSSESTSFFKGLVNSSNTAGAAIGSIGAGYVGASYGRRSLFIIGDILCIIGSGLSLIQNTASFVIGRFICGLGMGVLVSLVTLFVLEWTHYRFRGYAGGPMVCFTPLGMIISSLIGLSVTADNSNGNWRFLAGFPGMISAVHLLGYILVVNSDSPFQIYQQERNEQKALTALNSIYTEEASQEIMQKIVEAITSREQKNKNKRVLTVSEMFTTKSYRIRMIVCAIAALSVNFSGYFIISTYTNTIIMDKNGNDATSATYFSIYTSIADLLSVAFATIYIEKIGRKPIYLAGIAFTVVTLIIIGIVVAKDMTEFLPYLLIIFKVGFGTTISPLYPIVVSETIVEIGFIVNGIVFWVVNTLIIQLYPTLVDSAIGFSGIFWIFSAVMGFCFVSLFVLMKETKGLTLHQIHSLYQHPDERNQLLSEDSNRSEDKLDDAEDNNNVKS